MRSHDVIKSSLKLVQPSLAKKRLIPVKKVSFDRFVEIDQSRKSSRDSRNPTISNESPHFFEFKEEEKKSKPSINIELIDNRKPID